MTRASPAAAMTPLMAYLNLTLAMVLVGVSLPISKLVVAHVPPMLATEMRFVLVAGLLLPWALRHPTQALPRHRRDWGDLVGVALVGMVLFNLGMMYGLQRTSATAAGILTSTIPAMAALCGALLLRERPSRSGWLAIALAVAGVAIINLAGGGEGSEGEATSPVGNALVLGAVVSEGLYTVFARRLGGRVTPLATTFLSNVIAALINLPITLATGAHTHWSALPPLLWLVFALSSLANGLLALLLWMRGSAHLPVNRAGLFTGLLPVTVMVPSALLLGERPGWAQIAGLAVVLVGIAVGTGLIGASRQPPISE